MFPQAYSQVHVTLHFTESESIDWQQDEDKGDDLGGSRTARIFPSTASTGHTRASGSLGLYNENINARSSVPLQRVLWNTLFYSYSYIIVARNHSTTWAFLELLNIYSDVI